MIASLYGKITFLTPSYVNVEVNYIGYEVHISLHTFEQLQNYMNKYIQLYTKSIYKENAADLYGFLTREELSLFTFLIQISGIGPQMGLNLLSHFDVVTLVDVLKQENINSLVKIPKIGKSTAEKIIFEIKRKKKLLDSITKRINTNKMSKDKDSINLDFEEYLEEALLILGYQKKEIQNAQLKIDKIEKELPDKHTNQIQQWIKLFLKYI